eukprot:CAMPEP_0119106186 /NCGR_PEP_ID=MMETSP1180-20130426/3950_1 /TAXON_ID=3052 ORGANISM="Chlamydomonas cf sp, Strain CCMP681" /NCGR_SAMPLE_ID=MMETSP1180 /ASSEMBLY_ACC=CAM_ASM_000741 /LENGTH=214 /DNA_ID=CAMNT_0007091451 /DNA_START=183 /DNA_END=823 /DNA_ORIENTATION=-
MQSMHVRAHGGFKLSAARMPASPHMRVVHTRPLHSLQPVPCKPGALCISLKPRGALHVAHAANWNPAEIVKREQGLQSNRLPTALRERVEQAVQELRFRVTVGDVAARAGVKLSEADTALKALAYDTLATLEVSDQGDVVYDFPRGFQSTLQQKSLLFKALPVWRATERALSYAVRIAFGTALVASIAIVWLAITVIASSSNRDRDDRKDQKQT